MITRTTTTRRALESTTALSWGLQMAFFSPALAQILTALYDASTNEVGWSLALYNASAFIASLVIPARADRAGQYLRPMLLTGALTVSLALALAFAGSLPLAVAALIVLGGPASVGSTLLFSHLRHAGASPARILNTRAIVSGAWVAGPPLATLVIGLFGDRAILLVVAAMAAFGVATAARLDAGAETGQPDRGSNWADEQRPLLSRRRIGSVLVAFVLLQAGNATATSILIVYTTQTIGLEVGWAGVALGVAAGLEIPALVIIGRLDGRFSDLALITSGCVAGVAYYTALAAVDSGAMLLGIQILNAWSFAAIAGTGLTLFQRIVERPGLATGLHMNTYRVGAILSGAIIAIGSSTEVGQRGIFVLCAGVTLVGMAAVAVARIPPAEVV